MITIGSDPEFGLVDQNNQQIFAYNYLPENTSSAIGVDGHSHIGEIRPAHGETPREHLYNISALMMKVGELVPPQVKITAGSMVGGNDPIGGHIHFGGLGGSKFPLDRALRALDYYLALPVALLEVEKSARYRREHSTYGRLAGEGVEGYGYRKQSWGFEYRTLPSWLLGWGVTLSVLSIGYAIVDAVKGGARPSVPIDIPNPRQFNHCDKKALRPLLGNIKNGWRELPLYPDMRLEFAFLNHLLVHGLEWREGEDIRGKWGQARKRKSEHQVVGNPKDQNCPQIADLVKGRKGTKVFIYGLKPDREAEIAINDLDMVSGMDIGFQVQGTMYGVARDRDGWLCIGLSLELRQDIHAAAHLVTRILRTEPDIEASRIQGTNQYRDRRGRFQSRRQMLRNIPI